MADWGNDLKFDKDGNFDGSKGDRVGEQNSTDVTSASLIPFRQEKSSGNRAVGRDQDWCEGYSLDARKSTHVNRPFA